MEEIANEIDASKSFQSPPRRRRSTFFIKRESIVPQPPENVCKESPRTIEKNNEDLTKYHDKLLVEIEQWKNEVRSRRYKYHDLREQYQMALKAPSPTSQLPYTVLSHEDIEFLEAKVSVSNLVDSQLKLHKSVNQSIALYRRASELDDVILSNCEDKVNQITQYIFENSTVEMKD